MTREEFAAMEKQLLRWFNQQMQEHGSLKLQDMAAKAIELGHPQDTAEAYCRDLLEPPPKTREEALEHARELERYTEERDSLERQQVEDLNHVCDRCHQPCRSVFLKQLGGEALCGDCAEADMYPVM